MDVTSCEISSGETLTTELLGTLEAAIKRVQPGGLLHLVVRGTNDRSCAKSWPGTSDLALISRWEKLLRQIERADFLSLTYADRACTAVALELFMVSDRRCAAPDFSLLLNGGTLFSWPSLALYRLGRRGGEYLLRRLCWGPRTIDAKLALEAQVVDEIVEEEDAETAFRDVLSSVPASEIALFRRLMQDTLVSPYEEALGLYLAAYDRALRSSVSKL